MVAFVNAPAPGNRPVTQRGESPMIVIKVLRNLIAGARQYGQDAIPVDELEVALNAVERRVAGRDADGG